MGHRKQDINDFNARVKRISSPRNKSYYDPDLGMHIPKRVPRDKIKKAKRDTDEQSFLAAFIVSAVLGAFGYFIAQLIRVWYFPAAQGATMTLAVDLIITLWAIALLTALTGKTGVFARLSQVAGVYGMIAAGHNLFWRWPEQMAMIFPQAHVDRVLATTQEMSVVVAGNVFAF